MTTYKIGSVIKFHEAFDYETNCALCAKSLGDNFSEISLADGNVIVSTAEYNELATAGKFVFTAPIGSSCVKRIAPEAVAA